MEVERKRSKGGFFQLFDWNGKSRKKLFTSNSELPGSKQAKENVKNLPMQHQFVETDSMVSSSNRCSGDYNYASSVVSDEGCGSRAPGVVARLMGLDTLPTSNVSEPSSTPFSDYHSLRTSSYEPCATVLGSEYPIEYFNYPNKLHSFCIDPEESRIHKVQNRPIERFQTEMLPPKSAKSIPITHHKLLSPIKGPGFVPTKNAAYIMEAAAKIIEAGPQMGKISSTGSSSVPLRIRDLKERMEAAQKAPRSQRQKEPIVVRYSKGQSSEKGKLVSLASQAKINNRREEGSTSTTSRSLMNQRAQNELKSNPNLKNQSSLQNSGQKRTPSYRSNNVLKQNNLKQNGASNKDRFTKKSIPTNGATGPNRTVSKVFINSETGSRKMDSLATSSEKKLPSSKTKSFNRKGSVKRNDQVQDVKNRALTSKDKGSTVLAGCKNWDVDSGEKGMDVVSFTFTSPLRRPMHEAQSSGLVMEKDNSFSIDSFGDSDQSYSNHSASSSPRLDVIGSDALSELLDQKLRELTHRVECSHSKSRTSSCASSLQDSLSTVNIINSISSEHEKKFQLGFHGDQRHRLYGCGCPSVDDPTVPVDEKWQALEALEECSTSSNYSESGKELAFRHPTSISKFESSFACGSDMEKRNTDNIKGSKSWLLVHSQEVSSSISTSQSQAVEFDTELSDSASSISTAFKLTHAKRPTNWEIEYLKNILSSELRLKDFLLHLTDNVISPNLFDQLEDQENEMGRNGEEDHSKLERKIFFDCVLERLDARCESLIVGNCKSWVTWASLVNKKGWLAEQLYKEISGLKSMGDLNVDELVDSDMSTRPGRWLEFDIEAFEEGVEIEKAILSSLVNELVADFMI